MTHNQIEIGCDRSWTPSPHKGSSKTVTSRKLDCPFKLYARKYPKNTTCTVKVKNPEHSYDATENIMAHPAFRKFNEQLISQIAQISESLLTPRQIKAQLCSQGESDRPVILQEFPLMLLFKPKKKKNLCGPLQGILRDTLPPFFHSPSFHKTPS
ncbi:hypothetical protein O181_073059 [Austropuccinia psidii MF-1]|uniref:Uncharacterized protein n=1 Tax=Austropuccinia psidii MF-1 TaxID=1389203 RepID=A0A9Q3F6D3_9BASI|nr:hypothetical protein [Austropuccinia psidii MF-1]